MNKKIASGIEIACGDCRTVLRKLKADSVHCVVTSPPYYGLRDYGTQQWSGGDPDCDHAGSIARQGAPGSRKQASNRGANLVRSGNCRCGATRVDQQIGLEQTPEQYVDELVKLFREVKRVLRPDGTVWLNLGDSYASSGKNTPQDISGRYDDYRNGRRNTRWEASNRAPTPAGLKTKDLIGIPWRVALALPVAARPLLPPPVSTLVSGYGA